jgi:hypothetical protein
MLFAIRQARTGTTGCQRDALLISSTVSGILQAAVAMPPSSIENLCLQLYYYRRKKTSKKFKSRKSKF